MKGNAYYLDYQDDLDLSSDDGKDGDFQLSDEAIDGVTGRVLDGNEISELIVNHIEHGERLAKSFLRRWRIRLSSGQILSVVGLALCEAAHRFEKERGVCFKTFLFYHLKGVLVKELRRMLDGERSVQHNGEMEDGCSFRADEIVIESWPMNSIDRNTPEKEVNRRELTRLCWQACVSLDELEQEILVRHFVFEESLTDIAEELGYSRCHLSRVKTVALGKLEKNMKELRIESAAGETLDPEEDASPADLVLSKQRSRTYSGGRGRRAMSEADVRSKVLAAYFTDVIN